MKRTRPVSPEERWWYGGVLQTIGLSIIMLGPLVFGASRVWLETPARGPREEARYFARAAVVGLLFLLAYAAPRFASRGTAA